MKSAIFLVLIFTTTTTVAQNPSMKVWTEAWHVADADSFKMVYSENAVIFPPGKPAVKGNTKILEFMSTGMGKMDVFFETKNSTICGNLAFEYGIFKDVTLNTGNTRAKGDYSVTWILENGSWRILCHAWSKPVGE